MSRPTSAKLTGTHSFNFGKSSLSSADKASYEDLLVAQYLEELKKSAQHDQQSTHPKGSPYMQRLAQTHAVLTSNTIRRPQSAHVSLNKTKTDVKCSTVLWETDSPQGEVRRKRPLSAPVYRRPLSASYSATSHRPYSAKSGYGRTKALYKRQPRIIVVTAYKNGDRSVSCRVAAPSIRVLLEFCTDKLSLPNAARRIFLDNGREVFMPKEIPRGVDVYISTGEAFKNPYKPVKQQNELSKNMMWTMNGLVWSQDGRKHSTKPKLSKRFRAMIEQSRRRVLVFKNGNGSQGTEIVADPDRFEDFLVACTAKLDLGSYARVLYDWEGQKIVRLDDAPVLDQCLQTGATPVLGPLWVSKGEGFSPKGVEEFLKGLITYTQSKLKEAKHYKEQLLYGQDEETKDKVQIVAILSMSEQEIDEAIIIVDNDIDDFSNALNHLKEQREKIQDLLREEDAEGYEYKLKHIDKLGYDHRILGKKGIRLKVYENGSDDASDCVEIYFNIQQLTRGVGNDKELPMARLLDQCSSSSFLANPKKNPAIRPVAKKLFNSMGQEIKSIFDLEFDQPVWLSFGEPFKSPLTYVLTAAFDKVSVYDKPGGGTKVLKECLQDEDRKGREKSASWEAFTGLPPDSKSSPEPAGDGIVVGLPEDAEGHDPVPSGVANDASLTCEIQPNEVTILRAKDDPSILIIGTIVIDVKGTKDVWPSESQNWVISKAGYIYSRAMPQLVLTVLDVPLKTNLSHPVTGPKEKQVEGFLVGLQKKQSGFPNQQWKFTTQANIYASSHPELLLTYLGAQHSNDDTQLSNENEAGMQAQLGQPLYIAVCHKITGRDAKAQRWALKQERIENLGQWKHTEADPEWHKKAYSWPVRMDGSLNKDYDWPMEGYLLPYAPPIRGKKTESSTSVPLRLMVMKNGVRDVSTSVPVVGPDLSNMKKDFASKDKKGSQKNRKKTKDVDTDSIDVDEMLHCDEELTVLKLEFILFLERCTSLLDLPFAARRLFDETGREHFSLTTLQRDQLVYVSCGEPWTDPNLSKAEQQRRYLLANLASDVAKIRQFIALRDPEDLVLEVDGTIASGTKLCVNQCAINVEAEQSKEQERRRALMQAQEQDMKQREKQLQELAASEAQMTAHDRAHRNAEERLDKLKWPWERVVNGGYEEESDEEEKQYSNKELYRKFKRRPKRKGDDLLSLQRFVFEDGYIAVAQHPNLVLGVKETEGRIAEVVLVKRSPDDINQRWILQNSGVIQAKHNSQMVLTVSLPSSAGVDTDGAAISYLGCYVTVQALRVSQFGRANQRWMFEENTAFIRAFHTDQMDKEITAANKANVCTFAVMGDTAIDQPGYIVQVQQEKGVPPKKILVCSSCARAMRGRHKLEKVQGHIDFACSMGNAKELGVKQVGSFQCLNGKVDLSTFEAQHTLEEWESQLEKWRNELSVRVIARDISAAKVPYTVKVLAYKNGDGRLKPGELIVGSSVPGILEQCVHRLGLNQAARRLYTADGTLVLDTDDLIDWVRQEYVRQAQQEQLAETRSRRHADKEEQDASEGPKYLDKVDLDSDNATSTEDEDDMEDDETAPDEKNTGKHVRFAETSVDDIDITLGSSAGNRSELDPWSNAIIIPNPEEATPCDGQLTTWKLFARQPGQICLQILRPSGEDPMAFFLTGQVTYDIPSAGEHVIDIKDRPLKVKKGDVIGFYSMSTSLIPYEIKDNSDQCPYYLLPPEKPKLGQMLNFEVLHQSGTRRYSVCAVIKPNEVLQKPVTQPTPPRPKTASRSGKKRQKAKKKQPQVVDIEPPPIEMVLKYPIEVWVSMGEPFLEPEKVEKSFEFEQQLCEERAAVSYELQKEKHVLRQMQGRRYEEQNPGLYKVTRNPYVPVLKEGHWQEPTLTELQKHDMVSQLQTHLAEMRSAQKPKGVKICNAKTTRRLYTQPAMKRLLMFPNGESLEHAQYVWGENLSQLCNNATTRLNLRKPGKYLFGLDGTLIDDFDTLERDQLVCIANDKHFLRPKESQQVIEIKARWGRARKQYGPQATDIVVTSSKNPQVDVDPFGPSKLAGGPNKNRK